MVVNEDLLQTMDKMHVKLLETVFLSIGYLLYERCKLRADYILLVKPKVLMEVVGLNIVRNYSEYDLNQLFQVFKLVSYCFYRSETAFDVV